MAVAKYFDPRHYAAYVARRAALSRYNIDAVRADERDKFARCGLDPDSGLVRLNEVLAALASRPFDQLTGDDSVHWLLFAAISLTNWGRSVRDVLEIGTFRGKTTSILTELFPQAMVVTCDLPETDPILGSTYRRDNPEALREYREVRDGRVKHPRIRFVERNSFFLPEAAAGPYDLIWVDGGHHYPEVAWDISNAWHMCRPGGLVLCDDIFTHPDAGDEYASRAALEVIDYIGARTATEVTLFLKRENPVWSANPKKRKFVAVLRKPAAQPGGA